MDIYFILRVSVLIIHDNKTISNFTRCGRYTIPDDCTRVRIDGEPDFFINASYIDVSVLLYF